MLFVVRGLLPNYIANWEGMNEQKDDLSYKITGKSDKFYVCSSSRTRREVPREYIAPSLGR